LETVERPALKRYAITPDRQGPYDGRETQTSTPATTARPTHATRT